MGNLEYTFEEEDTQLPTEKEEKSVLNSLFYGVNSTYALGANQINPKLNYEYSDEAEIDFDNPEVKEHMSGLNTSVLNDINIRKISSFDQLKKTSSRIERQHSSLAHAHKELGTLGTIALGVPAALVDPLDAAAILPVMKLYSLAKTSTKMSKAGKIALAGSAGAGAGYMSESIYQATLGQDNAQTKMFASIFGGLLFSGGHVLTSGVRNTHHTTKKEDGTDEVIGDSDVANIKTNIETQEKILEKELDNLGTKEDNIARFTLIKDKLYKGYDVAKSELEKAKSIFATENKEYGNSVSLVGKEKADEAILNAKEALNKATVDFKIAERKKNNVDKNIKAASEGKPMIEEKVVQASSSIDTFKRELDEMLKDPTRNMLPESEGFMKKIFGTNKLYITPRSIMMSSETRAVRDFAARLVSPAMALVNKSGDVVVSAHKKAYEIKQNYNARWNIANADFHSLYNNSGFNGKFVDFTRSVEDVYLKAIAKASRDKTTPVFRHQDSSVEKAAMRVFDYYREIGKEGQTSGMTGMKSIDAEKGYYPMLWNSSKIVRLGKETSANIVYEAMLKHPFYAKKSATEEGRATLLAAANNFVKTMDDVDYLSQLTKGDAKAAEEATQQQSRKIHVYHEDVKDIIDTDLIQVGTAYDMAMSGRLALHKSLGASTGVEMRAVLDKLSKNGATPKERDAAETIMNSVLGTHELMKNPDSFYGRASRIMTKANFSLYAMGFGMTSAVELGNIIGTTGLRNTIGHHFNAISSVSKHYKGEKSNAKYINEMRGVMNIGDIISMRSIQRVDSELTLQSKGIVENGLDTMNNKLAIAGGLAPITDALKSLSMGSGYSWLVSIAKKESLSVSDKKRIARMGLSEEDMVKLADIDSRHVGYDKNGHLESFNFEKWDLEFGDRIQNALMRHVESTVLHPDGSTLPSWMSDPNSPISKIMLQFMRFPISSYETLALRGIDEMDSRQAVGIGVNMALFALLAQVKDFGKDKPRYDLSTDEGLANTARYAMVNSYPLAAVGVVADKVSQITTGTQLGSNFNQGSDYALGVTGRTLEDVQNVFKNMSSDGLKTAPEDIANLSPLNSVVWFKNNLDILNGVK